MSIDFIQIGAFSGLTEQKEDIIWPIIRKNKWSGIFVEPLPEPFKQLVKNYSDVPNCYFENVAVMNYDGKTDIYFTEKGDLRVASANINQINKKGRRSVKVDCITLQQLVEKYDLVDVEFELLQIDAEGSDGTILLSTDFTHILPRYIRFEHCHMSRPDYIKRSDVLSHLQKFGYKEIPDMYSNGIEEEKGIDTMMERKI